MKVHELKLDEKYFDLVDTGVKTFEIRKNDRDYRVGDLLALSIYDSDSNCYKQKPIPWYPDRDEVDSVHEADTILRKIIYMTDYEQKDGYVVLGIGKYETGDVENEED
ncbi:hypothetical protein LMG30234_GAICNKDF_00564 [Fructobacillus fructosus]|uniref:DUF3850 domain-containing protein n=1 Tax=Fructobacillus fructosus TaxID=1631 RepID=UPI002DA059EF|nr:hypothetical protein LMG30234_GAICNKDF_00564 [Fructobacillus fructosus]